MTITSSQLYNYYQCPHKVWMDENGPKDQEIQETNPFVQLLWDKGVQHEANIIKGIGAYLDLSQGSRETRVDQTRKALDAKVPLLYQPVLTNGHLLGIPDLLELQADGQYLPIDIKSGQGFEGQAEEGDQKQKKHYALQLCLYVEILQSMGYCNTRVGFIIDGDGNRVAYDLNLALGLKNPQTYWAYYEQMLQEVRNILSGKESNDPALSGVCKLCSWYYVCKQWCADNDDPTQVFYLGRSVRDKLKAEAGIHTVADVAALDVQALLAQKKKDKTFLKGLAEGSLTSAKRRAELFRSKGAPVAYEKINLPKVQYELFFDIEDDPTQDFVYLHGIYVRENGKEYFKDFTATQISTAAEEKAWADFWQYIWSLPKDDFAVYYYSSHEKATYGRLQKKYPVVISEEQLAAFFDHPYVIDLYTNIVLKLTDWPLSSYSIKELATYLGFKWRDATPSGALSIQWFNDYIQKNDPAILKRILEYNEDDCIATMVVKDKLASM